MNKIFWGLIFLFFNITIDGISILPAFVGYILIFMGMGDYPQAEYFGQARLWAVAGAILTGITWLPVLDLGIIGVVAGTVIQLMVTHLLVKGVMVLEVLYSVDLNAARLNKAWNVMAIGIAASLVMSWMMSGLALAALVVGLVAAVVYIVAFYRCKQAMPGA